MLSTDVKNNFKSLLEIDTDAALLGDTPMLIDECQTVPKLWDAVRYTVDHRRKMGQFILTDHSRTIFVPQSYHVRMKESQRTTENSQQTLYFIASIPAALEKSR